MHWAILVSSQAYWFTQCRCMEWGCLYPGSVVLLVGGWAMALFDLSFFFNAIVTKNS